MFVAFTWSPGEIHLFIGSQITGGQLIHAAGTISARAFLVDENEQVLEVGSEGVDVMGMRVYKDGTSILRPTAIDTWRQTKTGVELLLRGLSGEGYMFDVVTSNLSISTLVTGFEVFSKTRFVEIQREGIQPDLEGLDKLLPKKERNPQEAKSCSQNPHDTLRFLQRAVGYINFQNFGKCRDAFRATYGIDFSLIGISPNQIREVRGLILHRHRVIHISPLLGTTNGDRVPPERPVFCKQSARSKSSRLFRVVYH
jgi:hypothetical protein